MLTVLMETRNHEAELAHTLSVLVTGAVEGLVSDVVILDRGSQDGSGTVADAAGCRFLRDWRIGDVLGSVRGEWLLLLEPGARPLSGWVEEIAEYMALNRRPARFSPSRHHRRPFWRRIVSRSGALEDGFLIARQDCLGLAREGMPLAALAAGGGASRLRCEIMPARLFRR